MPKSQLLHDLHLPVFLLFTLLMIHAITGGQVDLLVRGEVFCQDCGRMGLWSLLNARPLVGATIEISCRDYRHNVIYTKTAKTNHAGWYYESLQGVDLKKYHVETPAHGCSVYLISSDDPTCNVITNTNFGITGASVRFDKTLYNGTKDEADIYSAGKMACRPAHCRPEIGRYN